MPSFTVHMVSSAVVGGAGAAIGVYFYGWPASVAAAAGLAAFSGGMVPDLDSDSGRPVHLATGLVSLLLSVGLIQYLLLQGRVWGTDWTPIRAALAGAGLLFLFNTVGLQAFKSMTSHRGMFHSLPTAIAYAALSAAVFAPLGKKYALGIAVAAMAGVLSHLLLDAIKSISLTPVKLWSSSAWASCLTWLLTAASIAWAWQGLGMKL